MKEFWFYWQIGWEHIISFDALDHILFLIAIAVIYLPRNWKSVLILVTAFTIGHSVTLLLSATDTLRISSKLVEFLIPLTIIFSAMFSIFHRKQPPASLEANYLIALGFGLIHGLGFANSIRFMLMAEEKIALPLFSFNLGLEAGQIFIVLILLWLNFFMQQKLNIKKEYRVISISGIALLAALVMAIQRFPYTIN